MTKFSIFSIIFLILLNIFFTIAMNSVIIGHKGTIMVQNDQIFTNDLKSNLERNGNNFMKIQSTNPNGLRRITNSRENVSAKSNQQFVPKVHLNGVETSFLNDEHSHSGEIPIHIPFADYWNSMLNKYGQNVPSKITAKIFANLVNTIPISKIGKPLVNCSILSHEQFVVVPKNWEEYDEEELAGNVKFEFIKEDVTSSKKYDGKSEFLLIIDVLNMSPEQIKENRMVAHEKDITWALGIILYRMLFNKHPMDDWEYKNTLNASNERTPNSSYFQGNGSAIHEPMQPMNEWFGDETDANLVKSDEHDSARIEFEQNYMAKLRELLSDTLNNGKQIRFKYGPITDTNEELVEIVKECLQTFPEDRISLHNLRVGVSLIAKFGRRAFY